MKKFPQTQLRKRVRHQGGDTGAKLMFFDSNLCLVAHTKSCEPYLAVHTADAKGADIRYIFSPEMPQEWVSNLRDLAYSALNAPPPSIPENRPRKKRPDGCCRVSAVPVHDHNGNILGVIVSLHGRPGAEKRSPSRTKDLFLTNMSHEIRTPMSTIKGLLDLLMMTPLTSSQREYVQSAIKSSNALLQIVNDILDFSKIPAGTPDIAENSYDPVLIADDITKVAVLDMEGKDLTIVTDIPPGMPSKFYGDGVRIRQIISNLVTNAVKYTPKGLIKVSMRYSAKDGGELCVSVADTGIGIMKQDLPKLFGAFSRVDTYKNRDITGVGLGLSICRQLALSMGGGLSVRSRYGRGSVFSFRVPQKIADSTPIAAVKEAASIHVLLLDSSAAAKYTKRAIDRLGVRCTHIGAERAPAPAGITHCIYTADCFEDITGACRIVLPAKNIIRIKDIDDISGNPGDMVIVSPAGAHDIASALNGVKKPPYPHEPQYDCIVRDATALIVEDHPVNLFLMEELLRRYGFATDTAVNGLEAVDKATRRRYDIIFMDHIMPLMDGVDALRLIKSSVTGLNGHTPVIAVTANATNSMQKFFLDNKFDDFISKPVELAGLKHIIQKYLPAEKIFRPVLEGARRPV